MHEPKRIVVTGATGLIGRALCAKLIERGYAVTVFSRDPTAARAKVPGAAEYIAWQPEESGPWATAIDGAYGVVYLAGEPLFVFGKRWTQAHVRAATEGRIAGIAGLVQAMAAAQVKPQVFVSASSVGAYGYAGLSDDTITEDSPAGADFWGQDSLRWEEAALRAETLGVRTVVVRTGYVLDAEPGGGLMQQAAQFRRGFGGPVLPGRQWLPWIHLADEAALFLFALEDARVHAALNAAAPGAVRNREFARALGKALGKPAWLPIPGFGLRMGLGIVADILLRGRRVVPQKALDLGYQFQYPALDAALCDLLTDKR